MLDIIKIITTPPPKKRKYNLKGETRKRDRPSKKYCGYCNVDFKKGECKPTQKRPTGRGEKLEIWYFHQECIKRIGTLKGTKVSWE